MDRSIGRYELLRMIRADFPMARAHDSVFHDRVRDPELLYCCGKAGWVVITGDKSLFSAVPHRAAAELGETAVFAFTNNHSGAATWSQAMLAARTKILRMTKHRQRPFMASIGLDGQIRAVTKTPSAKKAIDPNDEASFERALAYKTERRHKHFVIPPSSSEAMASLLKVLRHRGREGAETPI